LLEAHLAEGNYAQALRNYDAFSSRLWDEFGVEPSAKISELIRPLRIERGSRRQDQGAEHGFEDAGAGRLRSGAWPVR